MPRNSRDDRMPDVLRIGTGSLVVLVMLSACSVAPERSCTQIGSASGIAVTVERDLAPTLSNLSLTVCKETACTDYAVTLNPGTSASASPCPSTSDPDTTCGATMTPDGTQNGFVDIADLVTGSIKISATAKLGANALTLAAADIDVKQTFPNGDSCPPGGNQATISLSGAGIRAS